MAHFINGDDSTFLPKKLTVEKTKHFAFSFNSCNFNFI